MESAYICGYGHVCQLHWQHQVLDYVPCCLFGTDQLQFLPMVKPISFLPCQTKCCNITITLCTVTVSGCLRYAICKTLFTCSLLTHILYFLTMNFYHMYVYILRPYADMFTYLKYSSEIFSIDLLSLKTVNYSGPKMWCVTTSWHALLHPSILVQVVLLLSADFVD